MVLLQEDGLGKRAPQGAGVFRFCNNTDSNAVVWREGFLSSGKPFVLVRPAGRAHLEVRVLYTPDRGKC